jgi:hypothetical protein
MLWGDGFGGPPSVLTRPTLVDDAGRWHALRIPPALLARAGGAAAVHRRRVVVTARPGAPSTAAAPLAVDGLEVEGAAALTARAVTGSQPWVTILCRFADSPATPKPRSYFEGLMGAAAPGLDHYWREVSYGAVDLTGSRVVGWYDLPQPRSHYVYAPSGSTIPQLDFQRSVEDCTAAADRDIHLPDFVGINLMFNDDLDCCSWGGAATLTRDGQPRTYGTTWIPPWGFAHQYVVAHEMGHGFGLPHSSGPYDSTYDSDWDVMSGGGRCAPAHPTYGCVGVHTIAYHKDLLGWIAPARKLSLAADAVATVVLERLAQPGSGGVLLAEVPLPGSTTRSYAIEARRAVGYDAEVPGEGVVIHQVDTTRSDRTAEVVDVDGNRDPNDDGARWIAPESFADAASRISMLVQETTATGMRVTIVTGGSGLVVGRAGAGAGSVASEPGGIDCGQTCEAVFDAGATVVLSATPQAGSAFTGWSGCDASSGATCTVQMSASRTVTASFTPVSPLRPDLAVTAVGGPALARVGTRVEVTDTIVNRGAAPAGAFRVVYYLAQSPSTTATGSPVARRVIGGLLPAAASSGSTVGRIPLALAPGTYYLVACADVANIVAEADEQLNCLTAPHPVEVTRRRP